MVDGHKWLEEYNLGSFHVRQTFLPTYQRWESYQLMEVFFRENNYFSKFGTKEEYLMEDFDNKKMDPWVWHKQGFVILYFCMDQIFCPDGEWVSEFPWASEFSWTDPPLIFGPLDLLLSRPSLYQYELVSLDLSSPHYTAQDQGQDLLVWPSPNSPYLALLVSPPPLCSYEKVGKRTYIAAGSGGNVRREK